MLTMAIKNAQDASNKTDKQTGCCRSVFLVHRTDLCYNTMSSIDYWPSVSTRPFDLSVRHKLERFFMNIRQKIQAITPYHWSILNLVSMILTPILLFKYLDSQVQGLLHFQSWTLLAMIQDQLVQDWLLRAKNLLVTVIALLVLVTLLFFIFNGTMIRTFKKQNQSKAFLYTYRVLFWAPLALIGLTLLLSWSTISGLFDNYQDFMNLDFAKISGDIQAIIANSPLQKLGDLQNMIGDIKSYIRDNSVLLATQTLTLRFIEQAKTVGLIGALLYPACLLTLAFLHLRRWWQTREKGEPIVKINLTIERKNSN